MKKTKLLKTLLIPTLGVTALGTVVAFATSCNSAIKVTGVKLDKNQRILGVGNTETLSPTVSPADATDKSVTWSSSDATIASVDQDGKITALKEGSAKITVRTNDGGFTATCKVTVQTSVIHVERVELNKNQTTLGVGNTETLIAKVFPEESTDKVVTWSSSNTNVATVDANGIVTGIAVGTTVITVKTNDGDYTATCQVTVNKKVIHVTDVKLNKNALTLAVMETDTLSATISPEEATDKRVTWSSNYSDVATVDENGKITALKEGKTTITVTTKDGGKTDTCEVNVIPTRVDNYVCLTANAYSTFALINNGGNNPKLQYSTDGTNWNQYTDEISFSSGESLYLKGDNPNGWSQSNTAVSRFFINGDVSISGNIMGLLDNGAKDGDAGNITNIPNDYCFASLFFNSSGITSISKDFLPAKTLAKHCYKNMFYNCTSLTKAPALPARTLASECYNTMFERCTKLVNAPALPATELAEHCYKSMFCDCTSLTNAPELPATTLAEYCYSSMFKGCTSLANAPELPTPTLANWCYYEMFNGCTNLIQAPALPATTLAEACYYEMFKGCTSLIDAPVLPATTLADICYNSMFENCISLTTIRLSYTGTVDEAPIGAFEEWVNGVAASGTFYYKGSDTLKNFGFPEGWAIQRSYVCVTANENSTLELENNGGNNPDLQYSFDENNWSEYSQQININKGQTLYLKGNNPNGWSLGNMKFSRFDIKGNVSISGNVMGLLDNGAKEGDAGNITDIPNIYCFVSLFFNSSGITNVDEDFLPATHLTRYCYYRMFDGCTSLVNAPELPAKTLADYCYSNMFEDCTSLANAPALPATTLVDTCYNGMFEGCVSLTNAPELPAKTLADNCYKEMFLGCALLANAPELPATTLAFGCYGNMFEDCSALIDAPVLPATTLAENCYRHMFYNCNNLISVKIGYTGIAAEAPESAFEEWVNGVAASGTFYYKGSDTLKNFGFPEGWNIDLSW